MEVLEKAVEKSIGSGSDRQIIVISDNPPLDIGEELQSFGIEVQCR